MRQTRIGLGFGLLLIIAGCAHAPRHERTADTPEKTPPSAAQHEIAPPTPEAAPRQPQAATNLSSHMRDDAPLRYTVERGDTLWDLAATYLDDPWYWPQLWDNNPDIANPHRIYPGEVLVLSRGMDRQPRLSRDRTVHLSPRIRERPLSAAIPVIPYSAIRNFLESPRLIDSETLAEAPYIVSFDDQRLVAGNGATVYVRGADPAGPEHYELVHPDGPYRDAETHKLLGRKAVPVGRITIHDYGEHVATATIDQAYREAQPGDRLIHIDDENLLRDFYPHAPAEPISAHIISVYGGVSQIGQYDVVTLDRGARKGMQRGAVLDIYTAGRKMPDPVAGGQVSLPEVEAGRLMVFKVEDQVSFGLIMHATRAIHVKDVARAPETGDLP